LTETASISKNPNRRGFQSKSDFWGFLKFRTPGDPGKEGFLENRGFGPLFYINPSRRGPAVSRQEGSGKEGLGPLWGSPWSGCPGPGLREPGAGGTPPGNRGVWELATPSRAEKRLRALPSSMRVTEFRCSYYRDVFSQDFDLLFKPRLNCALLLTCSSSGPEVPGYLRLPRSDGALPRAPLGTLPTPPSRRGTPGNRGAPAREVDVKETSRGVRNPQKPCFWPKNPKIAEIWVFTRIFGIFD